MNILLFITVLIGMIELSQYRLSSHDWLNQFFKRSVEHSWGAMKIGLFDLAQKAKEKKVLLCSLPQTNVFYDRN